MAQATAPILDSTKTALTSHPEISGLGLTEGALEKTQRPESERTGDAVIAGRAAPGAIVEVLRNGERHDQAVADQSGQFVMVPPRLPLGDYELTLRSRQPDGKPRDRTSRQESQATESHRSRSACSGKQHHPTWRPPGGRRSTDQTMDATDTRARENRSRGCYQAGLYNQTRTHLALNKDSPVTRPIETVGRILPMTILGGLHHQYVRI